MTRFEKLQATLREGDIVQIGKTRYTKRKGKVINLDEEQDLSLNSAMKDFERGHITPSVMNWMQHNTHNPKVQEALLKVRGRV